MASTPLEEGSLHRETNWWGAFVVGLAGTILVVTLVPYTTSAIGGFSIPMYAVLTGVGVFLCFCLAELAAAMPERAGGLPSYSFETFRPFGDGVAKHIGGLSSWGYWLGWFTVAPINAIIAAGFMIDLFGIPNGSTIDPFGTTFGLPITIGNLITAAVILLVMFVPCYLGIRLGATFASVLGIASVVPLVLLILLPFLKPSKIDFGHLDGFGFAAGVSGTWQLVLGWAFIFTWSVLAMEAAACYIGECRDPKRDAKIAMTVEGLFGLFIYLAIPIMTLAVLGAAKAGKAGVVAQGFFSSYVFEIFGKSDFWRWVVGLMLIVALLLSVLNAVMGCSRGLWQNAHDGIIPRLFGHVNRHGAPDYAMVFSLICSLVLLLVGTPLEIYVFSNMGYLFACAVALVGFGVYKSRRADVPRPVNMPAWMGPVAIALGAALLVLWLVGGYVAADYAVGAGKRWLFFLGLFLLALYFPLTWWRSVEDRRRGSTDYSPRREQPVRAAE